MSKSIITPQKIRDHVTRLGELYPPIRFDSVDFTVNDPTALRDRFGGTLDYLARVELEVDRNVLELLILLPDVDETNRMFYADVWHPQEIQHGLLLDKLQVDLGRDPAEPTAEVRLQLRILASLSHLRPIQDIAQFLYYLTGASTERQAVLAYNHLSEGLQEMGEPAIAKTLIGQIKQQEPGHFAFYQMSATSMVQHHMLQPWQLFLARILRKKSYGLVGTNSSPRYKAQFGEVMSRLGFNQRLDDFAREIGRVEAKLLWANQGGMEVPPYIFAALRECLELYQAQGAEKSLPGIGVAENSGSAYA